MNFFCGKRGEKKTQTQIPQGFHISHGKLLKLFSCNIFVKEIPVTSQLKRERKKRYFDELQNVVIMLLFTYSKKKKNCSKNLAEISKF